MTQPEPNYEMELMLEAEAEQATEVVRLTAEGRKPAEIQRITGTTAKRQREINSNFQAHARSSHWINRRAKEIIAYGDVHIQSVIDRLNEVEEAAKLAGEDKLRADVLTRILNAETARITFLQKAGIINDQGIGAELAKREEREAQVVSILEELFDKYPDAGNWVKDKIMELNG